ncbi:MAG: YqeG family HAD IIIA-type phosphatase [Candidatus Ureaplasma intestinipullorum]|uniref:YqeG family HAD IIIA-type phosphatase n=1 Tax=Candidatus Ureaplasma intestinipullorum TaxID=2838770 RepID=A0A9E2KWG2_9BACT|nr:YqeG family HAD IIIA-type phosphatase [Candidatus Ureaplasma intestinipullorum]
MNLDITKIRLLTYLKPSIFVQNIFDIHINNLKLQGFKMVICDLDNTLVPHFTRTPTIKVIDFIKQIREQGLMFVIVSNNTKKRVTEFCKNLEIDGFIYSAMKPSLFKLKKFFKKHNVKMEDVIFIGDQVITDIWVANRLKCKSILTLPLVGSYSNKKGWIINFIDKYIYMYLQNKNLLNNDEELKIEELYEIL